MYLNLNVIYLSSSSKLTVWPSTCNSILLTKMHSGTLGNSTTECTSLQRRIILMKILQFGDDGDKVNNFDKFCFNRSNTQIFARNFPNYLQRAACSFALQGLRGQRFGMSVPANRNQTWLPTACNSIKFIHLTADPLFIHDCEVSGQSNAVKPRPCPHVEADHLCALELNLNCNRSAWFLASSV